MLNRAAGKARADAPVVTLDATGIADELGDTRVANFIMLGKYLALRPLVSPGDIETEIAGTFAGKNKALIDLNITAFRAGLAHK